MHLRAAFIRRPWPPGYDCSRPSPSSSTTSSVAAPGPSGGGERRYSAVRARLRACGETSPSRTSASPRRWNADSVERWPIDTMVVCLEPLVEQAVDRGLRRLVERGRGLVEEKIVRRLQDGAGNAEPLLLSERQHPVPVRLLREPPGERGQPDRGDDLGQRFGAERSRLGRIGDRGGKRADRKIGPLRQRHDLGAFGHVDGACAERPGARDRPEQASICPRRMGR